MMVFVYATLIFLVLRFSVTLFNFLSNPKLGYYGKHFNDRVSIIICRTGGGGNIEELMGTISAQDYVQTEVLTKRPEELMSMVVDRASGKYLLLLSDQVTISNGLINNLIYRTKVYDLAMLAILPSRKFKGITDLCCYSLNDFVLMNILPLRLVRLSAQPAFSVSNQACMFFKAEVYKENLNGEDQITIGREAMKQLKQLKYKTEFLLANKFAYLEERDATAHIGRRLLHVFSNNMFVALIYLTLLLAGPIVMTLNFEPAFLALPVGLIFLTRVMISFLAAQNAILNVILHPLQMFIMLISMTKAMLQ